MSLQNYLLSIVGCKSLFLNMKKIATAIIAKVL